MAAEGDNTDQKYECMTSLFLPPDNPEQRVGMGILSIEGPKPRDRMTVNVFGLGFKAPGLLRIGNKIRRLGTGEEHGSYRAMRSRSLL